MRQFINIVESIQEGGVLFHLTPSENVSSILKQGLIPQSGPRSEKVSDHGIFLFPTMEDVEDGWSHWMETEIDDDVPLALLKVVLPEGAEANWMGWEVVCYDPIPPQNIEVVTLRWGE